MCIYTCTSYVCKNVYEDISNNDFLLVGVGRHILILNLFLCCHNNYFSNEKIFYFEKENYFVCTEKDIGLKI